MIQTEAVLACRFLLICCMFLLFSNILSPDRVIAIDMTFKDFLFMVPQNKKSSSSPKCRLYCSSCRPGMSNLLITVNEPHGSY